MLELIGLIVLIAAIYHFFTADSIDLDVEINDKKIINYHRHSDEEDEEE